MRELGEAVCKYRITFGKCKEFAAEYSLNFTSLYFYSDPSEGEGRKGEEKKREVSGRERREK